jgi:hypothetical protein
VPQTVIIRPKTVAIVQQPVAETAWHLFKIELRYIHA